MLVHTATAARPSGERPIDATLNRDCSAVIGTRKCRHQARFEDHLLCVRWVRGGRERVLLDRRTLVLDEDAYLVLNEGRSYEVAVASATPVQSFAVYFRPGLAAEVLSRLGPAFEAELASRTAALLRPTFDEHLQPHDSLVSPVLRFIERHLDLGVADGAWYEEQLVFLLERVFRKQVEIGRREAGLGAMRRATRREVMRRVSLATDYIQSCYEQPITLVDVGAAAAMSPHHMLRLFQRVHGCSPREYLQAKRTRVAARLIATTELTLEEVAHRVGFEDRSTLGRHLRRTLGVSPRQLRAGTGEFGRSPERSGSRAADYTGLAMPERRTRTVSTPAEVPASPNAGDTRAARPPPFSDTARLSPE